MMDLTPVYRKIGLHHLKELRSKKVLRQTKLRSQPASYFALKELRALERQIKAIDAELQFRKDQMSFWE